MIRIGSRALGALLALLLAFVLADAAPAHASTAQRLDVVVVEQVTAEPSLPFTEHGSGTAIGSDQRLWDFTETIVHDHWFGDGPFSLQSGADELSGTVHMVQNPAALVPLTYATESWSYTATGGQGAYAGCTGPGTPVRQAATIPVGPSDSVVIETISFDLTCPS